jgi:FKBP-type peptidyl-prolyl cis-trans isomerase
VASCAPKNNDNDLKESIAIQKFLSDSTTPNFVLKESGLYYFEVIAGTGPQAATRDTAWALYTTKLLDGFTLYTNVGTTDTLIFLVNSGTFVPGFDEGITYMKAGGTSKFIVPSSLAYGVNGSNDHVIAGYTTLLYEVTLVRIKKGPGKK